MWRLAAAGLMVVLGACTAELAVSGSATPSVSQGPGTPTPGSTQSPSGSSTEAPQSAPPGPPLTDLERKVIGVLSELGIVGVRGETPFENANIWAQLGDGRELFVSAVPVASDNGSFVVTERRISSGVTLEYGRHAGSGDAAIRFPCSDRMYYVRGDTPAGFPDMDAFVDAFVLALDCSSG